MGYAAGGAAGVPPRPRGRRRPCSAAVQPAGPLHARRDLGPARAGASTRSRARAARSSRATPSRCRSTATHAAWPAVLAGRRRGPAVLHLSDAAAHDHHRPAQVGLGRAASATSARRWQEQGVRVRIVDVGGDEIAQRLAPGARPARPHDPRRRREPLGGDDPQRLAAHAQPAPRRSSASTTSRPRWRCRRSRPARSVRVPLSVRFPGAGTARPLAPAPRRRAAGRQPALGGRAGQGLAADPPGRRRAVVGAVRLGGRLPGRAAVDRRRRRRGLAGRGRPGQTISSPRGSSRPTCSSWPTSRPRPPSRPSASAGSSAAGMGLMIFTGAKLDIGLYNDLLYRPGEPAPAVPAQGAGRRDDPRADRRAGPAVAAREAARAEALGARARRGPPDHGGGRAGRRHGRRSGCWPAGTTRRRSPAVIERVVGDGRVLLWTTTADRAGNDWPIEPSFVLAVREAVRGTARPTSSDQHRHGRRAAAAGRPLEPAARQRPADAPGRRRAEVADGRAAIEDRARATRAPAVEIDVPDTRRAGLYRVVVGRGPARAPSRISYAANPDPRESDLERIAAADLKSMLAPLNVEIAAARGDGTDAVLRDRPRDLARPGLGARSSC